MTNKEFAGSELTAGQLNAVVKKLGGAAAVTLGLHKTPAAYRAALKAAGQVSSWGDDLLEKMLISQEVREIHLVVPSVADLGFTKGTRYDAICARAVQLGFDLCPAEVGPALQLAYANQPLNERLRVAMEAMAAGDGYLLAFSVKPGEDGPQLSANYASPDDRFGRRVRLVLALRPASNSP